MWMLLTALAWAGCTLEALDVDLKAARLAAEAQRLERSRVKVIEEQLACTTEVLPAAKAAEVHELFGLYYAQEGQHERAANHFLASWEADPFRPLPEVLPLRAPSRIAYEQLREARFDEGRATSAIAGVPPRVDGLHATWLTQGQPALVQHDAAGVFVVEPGGSLPEPGRTSLTRGSKGPLRAIGIAALGVSAATYGGAWLSRSQYVSAVDSNAPDSQRTGPHAANRVLSISSVGFLALGGVTLAASF